MDTATKNVPNILSVKDMVGCEVGNWIEIGLSVMREMRDRGRRTRIT